MSVNLSRVGRTLIVVPAALLAVYGCSADNGRADFKSTVADVLPSIAGGGAEGFFSGSVTMGGKSRYGEMLVTRDGLVRLFVANAEDWFVAADSIQFLGELDSPGSDPSGQGSVIGIGCTHDSTSPFCGRATPARIELSTAKIRESATYPELSGKILVAGASGDEVWEFAMAWPTRTYLAAATLPMAAGLYLELRAEFSHEADTSVADTVVVIDDDGRLYFQSAASGCVGNGSLSPHADGARNVFEFTLTIEICDEAHATLNGIYAGLGTRTVYENWLDGYDALAVWLTSQSCTDNACTGVTMWGSRL